MLWIFRNFEDVKMGNGAEWAKCVCNRWTHIDCISQTAIDEAGEKKVMFKLCSIARAVLAIIVYVCVIFHLCFVLNFMFIRCKNLWNHMIFYQSLLYSTIVLYDHTVWSHCMINIWCQSYKLLVWISCLTFIWSLFKNLQVH